MFRLAHVTDPHFRGGAWGRPGLYAGKRTIGMLNLVINRGRKHKAALLEALGQDLRAQPIDHVAVTGDLANVALVAEWKAGLRWLEGAGATPERTTVIPGNHDAYVADVVGARTFERLFGAFQTADLTVGGEGHDYPFVRIRGDVALIGVCSGVPTGDLGAWGEVGAAQLARLQVALVHPTLAGKTRVVLIHHPPVMQKGNELRNLRDRDALAAALARTGAELVIHGHDHRDERATLPGPGGTSIPIIGAGSASYAGGPDRRARYNIYELDGPRITYITRAHDEASGTMREVRREQIG